MADFSREELIEYFNEHVLYELLMLRYSRRRLSSETQILWNAMFATFNVSARNLYDFLNNKGTKNEVNVHEYTKHAKNFRLTSITKITGTLQLMNEQVFHMGKKRPKQPDRKITLDRVEAIFAWAESNILGLAKNFEDSFRAEILLERADVANVPVEYTGGPTGPGSPTPAATNHIYDAGGVITPNQTNTTHISGGFPGWPPKKES